MNVGVWTVYYWECSECCAANSVDWQPIIGETLVCGECDNEDRCDGITEQCRPERDIPALTEVIRKGGMTQSKIQALNRRLQAAEAALDFARARWTFNNSQEHTHTWHDWADWQPLLAAWEKECCS